MPDLNKDFEAVLQSNAIGSTPIVIWQWSVKAVLEVLMAKAIELGREYRDDLEAAARAAVDRIVAMDLPGVPEGVEKVIDDTTRDLAYQAIAKVLDVLLAE